MKGSRQWIEQWKKADIRNAIPYFKTNYISITCSILILLMCFLNGVGAKSYLNFSPINGVFQNYNPVRRWLAGQVPVRDFSLYLGYGHLILGSIMTWIFGGGYEASLCAFSFLTMLSLAVISYVIGKSILQSGKAAQVCTVILLVFLSVQFISFPENSVLYAIFDDALARGLQPGNSARLIRGVAPALYVCIVEFGFCCMKHSKYYKALKAAMQKRLELVVIAAVGGLLFLHSNDYGISTWLCAGISYAFKELSRERKFLTALKAFIGYITISLLSGSAFVMLYTHGHLKEWIDATFGIGGFQTWYYQSAHSHYIYDVDFTFLMMVQALFVLYYGFCVFQYRASGSTCRRYGIPMLLNMTAFCAANEYKMVSGHALHEVAYTILALTVGYEIILTLWKAVSQKQRAMLSKRFAVFAVIVGGAWSISYGVERTVVAMNTERGTYIEELGGYMTNLSGDLVEAKDFLGDKKIFSTYASALEVMTDQYQPSGYDYIIHVLGEEAREEYLKCFREENFDYAVTIRAEYTEWENWVRNANWFFYRELYSNYHPVYCNSYELFWEKNEEGQSGLCVDGSKAMIKVQPLSDSKVEIIVTCEEDIDGVVDVDLAYHLEKSNISRREKLMWFSCVNVKDTTPYQIYDTNRNHFNLPKEGCTNIPITMIDGEGEAVISSQPDKFTKLFIDDISCSQIYTVPFSYIDLVSQAEQIMDEDCVIKINNDKYKQKIEEKITQVILNGESWDIVERRSDDYFIYLTLKGDANKFNAYLGKENVVQVR